MSLIKCPECSREISDKAKFCPHCGYEPPQPEPKYQGVYCPRCLDSDFQYDDDDEFSYCTYCHIPYRNSIIGTFEECYEYGEKHPELKETPEFDIEAYNKRINWVPISYNDNASIKCPTCKSANVHKIGGGERAVSVMMLGKFSKKINKSFKCNSCGYTW